MPVTYTPIRYPGGKSKIYPLVNSIMKENGLIGCTYVEAYCGGAGLAMKLLLKDEVSRVILNDVDPAVYSMWDAIVRHPNELCDFIESVPLAIDEWVYRRKILFDATEPSFELGKAAFYLNRTNRSGILRGGPIGGMKQNGKYGLDARFNRPMLCGKVQKIAAKAARIDLYNYDACYFIDAVLAKADNLFANFDPPYVEKGPGLYKSSYERRDHEAASRKIAKCGFPWIVTYDDTELVRDLYDGFEKFALEIAYSAAGVKKGTEILITGRNVGVPVDCGLVMMT